MEREDQIIIDSRDEEEIRRALKERIRSLILEIPRQKSVMDICKIIDQIKDLKDRVEQYLSERNC